MPRIIIARRANQEITIPLDQERITIGRDKKADLFLDDHEISRRHAVIINKFGTIYIENVSATGQIHRGNDPVEFCELASGEEVRLGSYLLSWKDELTSQGSVGKSYSPSQGFGKSEPVQVAAPMEVEANAPYEQPLAEEEKVPEEAPQPAATFEIDRPPEQGADFVLSAAPEEAAAVEEAPPAVEDFQAPAEQDNFQPVPAMDGAMNPFTPNFVADQADHTAAYSADGSTKISTSDLSATLKILKGEEEGREIILTSDQAEWIIGRGSKCDIPVDNPKLSRSHFKIYRDGRFFKICDLGGSSGTRLNGVSISDARLNSFDTIKAGTVEVQFVIGENQQLSSSTTSELPNLSSSPKSLGSDDNLRLHSDSAQPNNPSGDKTAFAAPVPYSVGGGGGGAFAYTSNQGASDSYQIPNPNMGTSGYASGGSSMPELPQNAFDKAKLWYADLKPVQKVAYPVLLALLVAGIILKAGETTTPPPVAEVNSVARDIASEASTTASTPTNQTTADKDNAAVPGDISPKYYKLTKDKRDQIDSAYAKAERARQDKNWDEAYKYSKEVIDAVDTYKKANDILYEAQTNKTSTMLGNVSTNLNNVNDAAKENQEKIDILLEAGETSLRSQKWEDAEENFRRAMNLDPNNTRASQGYNRARKHDLAANFEIPAAAQVDPNEEARLALEDQLQSLNKMVNTAKEKIRAGGFNEGLSLLRQLDVSVKELTSGLKGDRAPASIRDFGVDHGNKLQMSIRESIDFAKLQLDAQYQTQLADADAFVSNKQYIQAKDIYNKILRMEPEFDHVKQERNKLYAKILSEAREKYQEALVHETVGDIDQALEGFELTKELLQDVDDNAASEYYRKSQLKVRRLKR